MLREQDGMRTPDRPTSRALRLATTVTLVAVTVGVATLRGPARGDDGGPKPADGPAAPGAVADSAVPPYVGEGKCGMGFIRPAALARRMTPGALLPMLLEISDATLLDLEKLAKVDRAAPGFRILRPEDIEWASFGISLGRSHFEDKDMHSLTLGGLTVRTTAPFDWPAFLRQWRFDLTEAREAGRSFYKLEGPGKPMLGPSPCVLVLDDRTVVLDEEKPIRAWLRGESPTPAYLQGEEWRKASRGAAAAAISNRDGVFAKQYDVGRADDAQVLPFFRDVDHWVVGFDDSAEATVRATAVCRDDETSRALGRLVEPLLAWARAEAERALQGPKAASPAAARPLRIVKTLWDGFRVETEGRCLRLRSENFTTLAEIAALIEAEVADEAQAAAKARQARAAEANRK